MWKQCAHIVFTLFPHDVHIMSTFLSQGILFVHFPSHYFHMIFIFVFIYCFGACLGTEIYKARLFFFHHCQLSWSMFCKLTEAYLGPPQHIGKPELDSAKVYRIRTTSQSTPIKEASPCEPSLRPLRVHFGSTRSFCEPWGPDNGQNH